MGRAKRREASERLGCPSAKLRAYEQTKIADAILNRLCLARRVNYTENWAVSMQYQLYKLTLYLRGWINYYGIENAYQKCVELDHWIRRRVRMCYWRQWRKLRTKVANLLRLGAAKEWAMTCGSTEKGPWRSSKAPGIQQVLSNNYLKEEGLYSLREGWIKVHYPNG